MSTTEITVSTGDIATAIALHLSPLIDEPTRFTPNRGKLLIRFGLPGSDKAGLALIKAQMPGNFVAEVEFNLQELAKDSVSALKDLAEALISIHTAAVCRRADEQSLISSVYKEMKS